MTEQAQAQPHRGKITFAEFHKGYNCELCSDFQRYVNERGFIEMTREQRQTWHNGDNKARLKVLADMKGGWAADKRRSLRIHVKEKHADQVQGDQLPQAVAAIERKFTKARNEEERKEMERRRVRGLQGVYFTLVKEPTMTILHH